MGKQKLSDEQKEEMFQNWQAGNEYTAIKAFVDKRLTIKPIEYGTVDISDNLQPFLDTLFKMIQDLKVPGRKAKEYNQKFVRTMFFEKSETVTFDGITYDVSPNARFETYNAKVALVEVYNYLEPDRMGQEMTFDTYTSWKKELNKACKEWDKFYVKHSSKKGTYEEINAIHENAMKPLMELVVSNLHFHRLEMMIKSKMEVPKFRYDALEFEFAKFLTGVMVILKDFGTLDQSYHIQQMLDTLKIKDWKDIVPFAFYLQPLQKLINDMRNTLLGMEKLGPLRIKYIIEKNVELQDQVKAMVKQDNVVQWLIADELKQDQFLFFYDTVNVLYQSAVRDKLLAQDVNVLDAVIPKLLAYRSIMVIREIQLRKAREHKKLKEKMEREENGFTLEGNTDPRYMTQFELECLAIDKKQEENPAAQKSPEQIITLKEEIERKIYGRFWVWEGYYNEKNNQQWLDTAEALKHVNDHILQDIEDSILLEAFKGMKPDKVRDYISSDHDSRINNQKKLLGKNSEAFMEKALADNKKRSFLNGYRPPDYWNFFEDCKEEDKIEHVLRFNAKPIDSYKDGRIGTILKDLEEISMNLSKHEPEKFQQLRKRTLAIFKDLYDKQNEALDGM